MSECSDDFWDYDDRDICPNCDGDGWIFACDGDPSDWMEDCYSGPDDATMKCRHCNGKGVI